MCITHIASTVCYTERQYSFVDSNDMKVLHVFKNYFPETLGGIEQIIHELILSGQQHGIVGSVFCLSHHPENTSELPYPVHRIKTHLEIASTPFSWHAIKAFKQLSKDTDIIHYHYPWPFMDLLHLLTRPKQPCVVTYHADITKQRRLLKLYQPLQRWFLGHVDKIVATSPQYANSSTTLRKFAQKTEIIPLSINEKRYARADSETLTYWKARLPDHFCLFVGVLRYYKDLSSLIASTQWHPHPIVIAGDGPLADDLKAQAEALGNQQVLFVGKVSDIDKVALLELCTVFTFPSHLRAEAFGIALLEAAMFAKPLISCDIGSGMSYINQHGETGYEIPPQDPQTLAKTINHLFADPNEAARMGNHARKRFLEHFSSQETCLAYAQCYRALITNR